MENKKLTGLLFILSFVVGGVGVTFLRPSQAVKVPKTVLPMPAGNIRPPREFISQYHRYTELQTEQTAIGTELLAVVPKGYTFDADTESFKPTPLPTPAPPTVVPQGSK